MTSIESKGKTVDEAITNGLRELGLSIDEVDIEILHEGSKGLFGLGKSALVRMSTKGEGRSASISSASDAAPVAEAPTRTAAPSVAASEISATEFLNGLFGQMKVSAASKVTSEEENLVKIDIEGQDTAVLIGRRGDTLDALQYLTSLVINRGKEGYTKVMLDAENYREKREVTLEKLAKRLANTVARTGKPITLEPMNPYERRILHSTLQSNPRVTTVSEGEEPYRRVVIKRKKREYDGQNRRPH